MAGVQQGEPGVTCKNGTEPPFPTTPSIFLIGSTAGVDNEHATLRSDDNGTEFYSGAGFSDLYPVPDYQKHHQKAYYSSIPDAEKKYFNGSGRVFTDGSAYGEDIPMYIGGELYSAGGTSASSPIFASHLAMLNAARRDKGLGKIGYIHNIMYRKGQSSGALRDITKGKACGCPSPYGNVCLYVNKGYDGPTGLGVPNFPGLLSLFGAT